MIETVEKMSEVSIGTILFTMLTFIVGLLVIMLVSRLLSRILKNAKRLNEGQREFLRICICGIMMIVLFAVLLNILGTSTMPSVLIFVLLAMLVGYAAKSCVENMAAGLYLVANKAFKAGDFIFVNGDSLKGTVCKFSLTQTSIREINGSITTIPNSELLGSTITVMKEESPYVDEIMIPVPVSADQDLARAIMEEKASAIPHVLQNEEVSIVIDHLTSGRTTSVVYGCYLPCEFEYRFEVSDDYNREVIKALKEVSILV